MISKDLQNALNDQINAELWSAYLYLSMSLDAESKTLNGIAKWFFAQWMEEQDHARIFQKYMSERGAKVELKPIAAVPKEWKSPLEMFKDALDHEVEVTAMIYDLVKMAASEGDFTTLSRLQWFVDEQVEEEKSAADIVTEFERAGKDYSNIRDIDACLGRREYKKAGPLA